MDRLPGQPISAAITNGALTAPLQRYMLPQLTAHALGVLPACCNALHQLVNTAPSNSLRPVLHLLLPPAIRHCAVDSRSMQALLRSQAIFPQSARAGIVALQRFPIADRQEPRFPLWAAQSPCRSLALTIQDSETLGVQQLFIDPCSQPTSTSQHAAGWLDIDPWHVKCVIQGNMLLQQQDGLLLDIVDLRSQNVVASWRSSSSGCMCEAWPD